MGSVAPHRVGVPMRGGLSSQLRVREEDVKTDCRTWVLHAETPPTSRPVEAYVVVPQVQSQLGHRGAAVRVVVAFGHGSMAVGSSRNNTTCSTPAWWLRCCTFRALAPCISYGAQHVLSSYLWQALANGFIWYFSWRGDDAETTLGLLNLRSPSKSRCCTQGTRGCSWMLTRGLARVRGVLP